MKTTNYKLFLWFPRQSYESKICFCLNSNLFISFFSHLVDPFYC